MQVPLSESSTLSTAPRLVVRLSSLSVIVCLFVLIEPIVAQNTTGESNVSVEQSDTRTEPANNQVVLSGVVVEQKKYSFVVQNGDQRSIVKLADQALVALRLNKPYFDWEAGKVIVEPVISSNRPNASTQPVTRVGYRLPAKQLYLISNFRSADHMKRMMTAKPKRINFYLIGPQDLGSHEPTEDELYLSGKLKTGGNDENVQLVTDQSTHSVKLGFREATMKGFSIADLKPYRTRLTLAGVRDRETGDLIASSVVFEPIVLRNNSNQRD